MWIKRLVLEDSRGFNSLDFEFVPEEDSDDPGHSFANTENTSGK